jgi:hypothetical protein
MAAKMERLNGDMADAIPGSGWELLILYTSDLSIEHRAL